MIKTSRLVLASSAALAAALLITGCTATPAAETPTSVATPDSSGALDPSSPDIDDDMEAVWLDDGRMFAIVSWGSSSCVPVVDEATASGQTVTVTFAEPPADQICTSDYSPRASVGAVPVGVDPTKDVEFVVTLDDVTDDVELDGNPALAGIPGDPTEYAPSAGWFGDDGVVLLTWGSSGCQPIVDDLEMTDAGATVTFRTEDRACTKDMAPRATLLDLGAEAGDDADDRDFVLTLVGDNLDGTVNVLRG